MLPLDPDGFHARLLRNCKEELAVPLPLQILWTESLKTGTIPPALKTAIITPIHKGRNKGLLKNYRPVALTSHLIKAMQKIVKKYVVAHLEKNKAFNDGQHGFGTGRSCLSQLLEHYEGLLEYRKKGINADVIYTDFAKAFDKVDHNIVLCKLKRQGV
ncbi:hypothetical protein Pcinc_030491 [Petrolisthes cinctipes]|uniref:Reverse transcriptase domain-containing protein n=1 Tax=Petrolisthes cinctipes TaxID=88211 RepID=A0AAE1K4D2_PETCI|nr:hypothetical protein Pcinc_030491 [Petrolisthes cinctipes]